MQRKEMTLGVERELGMGEMVASLVVGEEAFRPRRDPADRTAQPPRRPGDERLLRVELALVAEAAAHIGRDHAQRALGHAELLGHLLADVVRCLRRAHKRELAGAGLDRREHRARLDRRADEAVVDEIDGDLVRRGRERGAHRRLVAARPAEADVAGRGLVQLRRASRLRGAGVGRPPGAPRSRWRHARRRQPPHRASRRSPPPPARPHGVRCRAQARSAAAAPWAFRHANG